MSSKKLSRALYSFLFLASPSVETLSSELPNCCRSEFELARFFRPEELLVFLKFEDDLLIFSPLFDDDDCFLKLLEDCVFLIDCSNSSELRTLLSIKFIAPRTDRPMSDFCFLSFNGGFPVTFMFGSLTSGWGSLSGGDSSTSNVVFNTELETV